MTGPVEASRESEFGLEIKKFLRANASSIVATSVDWVLVTVLVAAHVHYLAAATVGALVGAVTDFIIKRHWAFIRTAVGGVRQEAARYVAASAATLGLNLLTAYGFVDRLHFAKVPGVIAASILVGAAFSYPVHRYYVFPERQTTP